MTIRIDPEILRRMWPHASQAKIDAVAEVSAACFDEFGFDDWNAVAELMGNISHENGGGTIVRESGNYRPARIKEIFGWHEPDLQHPKGYWASSAKVADEECEALAGNAKALFDRVYNLPHSPKLARELGNHEPGDGFKFRGAGDLQTTGRASIETMAARIDMPELAENPDLLADPKIAFRVACADFAALGCVALAKRGASSEQIRIKVNGGRNGLSQAMVWVRNWKKALPEVADPEPAPPRGADTDNKTLMSSKIMKGIVTTAASSAVGVGSKIAENANTSTATVSVTDIADKVNKASDTITTVQIAADSAKAIVTTVKPVLGLPPNLWAAIAIGCMLIAIGTLAYTGWQRWAKLRDQGV